MDAEKSICILNDSFPPLIDGVSNAVMNYARVLSRHGCDPIVITPAHPDAADDAYPYSVIRYPSMDLRKQTGYMAGIPFSPDIAKQLTGKQISLLHSHCPIMSTILGRELRQITDAPLVLTYHTKFDIDIANIMKSEALRSRSKHALVQNINSCDEVWAVSRGAAENLRSLGYEGECIVMPNGVDLPRGRVSDETVTQTCKDYDLPAGVPVYLFVGRMMWYKGLRITLSALAKLRQSGADFRMVFIGGGADLDEIKEYAEYCGVAGQCIFTGPIHDREALRAWYCRADLFLFPSTFDTNGLVVREAAACSLGAVLIRGSCAAEDTTDGRNCLHIDEDPESLYACLHALAGNRAKMAEIGQAASEELYISWDDAVQQAAARYDIVIERYQAGKCPGHYQPMDEVLKANAELMEDLGHIQLLRENLRREFRETIRNRVREHILEIAKHKHNS